MEQNYELTTRRYFFELGKLFLKSIVAYCLNRDDQLEKLYYRTMDIHIEYIEKYYDEEEKEERFKERIYELLDLIALREQNNILKIKDRIYKGIKLRENIIDDMYIELWLINKDLYLYIFEKCKREEILPFYIEDPYLICLDQVYYALRNKRVEGLLSLLYKKSE
ncbi:hypothetical protein FQB35_00210 [Crassaminicella thermophila]|uniref:Uncharacterized protein n=1 Tax=Crassaminicella thermophila TaxID=2599308 RepID=A0A5C0SDC2_CRATE|nr:hypothetical protein [Crassaminicella thermophila]QEK10919.1 hypothetical protein FQB35_00210 [Crassaminicella thermophila]